MVLTRRPVPAQSYDLTIEYVFEDHAFTVDVTVDQVCCEREGCPLGSC